MEKNAWSDFSFDLAYDVPQICWTTLSCLFVGSDMHMVGEGSETKMVPGIIPTVTGFPTQGLSVVAILFPGNPIAAGPLYLYVLGKE